jgi:inorganic pyrophosphatase/exopolyphosphatase
MFLTGGNSDTQFIFKENDFEADSFQAAAFVAKYRRVSSLESLKEQLLQYSNVLKQQLYNIINRDYKDFITISTKVNKNSPTIVS